MSYYLFERNSNPGRWIDSPRGDDVPRVDWYYWRKGSPVPPTETIPNPIRFTLKPQSPHAWDHGPHLPSYLGASVPLFTDDLIAALQECGVSNLVTYPTAITDPDNGQVYTHYKAVNIIGLIAAADMQASNAALPPSGPALIDVDFDGLVIDSGKTRGALFFRLAESTNALIVHESVRDHLLAKGFDDLAFYDTEKVAV